jgi:hypothetical protein
MERLVHKYIFYILYLISFNFYGQDLLPMVIVGEKEEQEGTVSG